MKRFGSSFAVSDSEHPYTLQSIDIGLEYRAPITHKLEDSFMGGTRYHILTLNFCL